MVVYTKKNKNNSLQKLKNYVARKILLKNREMYHAQGFPTQIGYINDYIGISISVEGIYEVEELDVIFDFLSKSNYDFTKKSALDIGANIGNHSLYFSKIFKTVHSFEPNPNTFDVLGFNTKNFNNIKKYNFGFSNFTGLAEISENPLNIGGSTVYLSADKKLEGLIYRDIKLTKLDGLNEEILNSVALVKIDVEGHEYEVLKGGERFFRNTKPIILFEQYKEEFEGGKSNTIETLRSYGYKFIVIEKSYSSGMPIALRFLLRFLISDRTYLKVKETIEPNFYNMIVAVHSDRLL